MNELRRHDNTLRPDPRGSGLSACSGERPGPLRQRASVSRSVEWARYLLRPFGYLAFVIALLALSGTAKLLGEKHELGYFANRLSEMLWRYPEVTRRGVQVAWLVWAVLFLVAITPMDPLATPWDEVVLGALALSVAWHRIFAASRAGR